MNIFKSSLITFLVIIISGCASASYKKDYEEAKNSIGILQHAPTESKKKRPEITTQNQETKTSEDEFKKIKERWADLIRKPFVVNTFFDFDTEQSKKIREIAATDKINELLGKEIDLDLLIVTAFEKSPIVAAAKKEWEAAIEKYDQVARLDNLLSQYKSFMADSDTKTSVQMKSSVKESFPLPGILTLKGDIVEKEVLMARESYLIALRDLIIEISSIYAEIVFINEKIDIVEENLRLIRDLEKIASLKYSTGITGFNDVINAQIEESKLATELIILKQERNTANAGVNRYLSRASDAPLGMPKTEELKLFSERRKIQKVKLATKQLYETGVKNQQELKVLNFQIEALNLMITMAEKEFYPDFAFGFSYQDNPPLMDRTDDSPEGQMREMPPFWFGANDAYIREARLKYQKLVHELSEAKNRLSLDTKEILFQIEKADREIELYENSLLSQVRKSVEVAQADYSSGKTDFFNVLYAQQKILEFNLNYKTAIKDYNQNFFRVEKIIGTKLN